MKTNNFFLFSSKFHSKKAGRLYILINNRLQVENKFFRVDLFFLSTGDDG